MTHEYSVQIHAWISERIDAVRQNMKRADGRNDDSESNYLRGHLQELYHIRQYLTDKIDLDTQEYYH